MIGRHEVGKDKHIIEIALTQLAGKVGKVGWLDGSKYFPEQITVAEVAAQNEYGNPRRNIPARPFMRPTIEQQRTVWMKIAEKGAKNVLKGTSSISDVMEMLGLKAAGDVRKTITRLYHPALAEATILARISRNSRLSKIKGRFTKANVGGITKPLVDTGFMLGTLTNSVEDE